MKTKEEIYEKHQLKSDYKTENYALDAMQEYAEIFAMGFAEWSGMKGNFKEVIADFKRELAFRELIKNKT